jgi:hypothetical protein
VHLDSPDHGIVIQKLSPFSVRTLSVHHTTTQNLVDIPVSCEFPDLFPDDLHDMLPDHDAEFTIEL